MPTDYAPCFDCGKTNRTVKDAVSGVYICDDRRVCGSPRGTCSDCGQSERPVRYTQACGWICDEWTTCGVYKAPTVNGVFNDEGDWEPMISIPISEYEQLKAETACNPPEACQTHGRCWTHSHEDTSLNLLIDAYEDKIGWRDEVQEYLIKIGIIK